MLTEKKRKWIITQFRAGRSATQIAKIQKVSRQYVYKLAKQFKKEGTGAYIGKRAGRPPQEINTTFSRMIISQRKITDYGSQKLHFVSKKKGFNVSQRQIQKILDVNKLTVPCKKRRGQRSYVSYEWPISNYMWHCDWSFYKGKWYLCFLDDKSRKIIIAGEFNNATEKNAIFLLYQAILVSKACPVIVLSDKGTQFYNSKRNKKGERTLSLFEQELQSLGIQFWTSRRNHPQTNGKMEKWFDYMKKRMKQHPEHSFREVVGFYNTDRIHHALEYKTPNEVYQERL